jgi:hypothetical protein
MPDSNAQSRTRAGGGIHIGMGSLLIGLLGIGPGGRAAEAAGAHWTMGALIGYWVAVFLFAWIIGILRERNTSGLVADIGGVLRDPWLWPVTLLCTAVGAAIGLWFGPSNGESALVGAVALGIIGLALGFGLGLVAAWGRRRSRAYEAGFTARERFVTSLNERSSPDLRHSIDPDDPGRMIVDFSRAVPSAIDGDAGARLRASIESRAQDFSAAVMELRQHGFSKWVFRLNGETMLERRID